MTILGEKTIGSKPAKNFDHKNSEIFDWTKNFNTNNFLSSINVALIGSEREPMSIKNLLRLKYEMVLEMTL